MYMYTYVHCIIIKWSAIPSCMNCGSKLSQACRYRDLASYSILCVSIHLPTEMLHIATVAPLLQWKLLEHLVTLTFLLMMSEPHLPLWILAI